MSGEDELEREPAWLTSMLDQRLAQLKHQLGKDTIAKLDYPVLMLSLTDPPLLQPVRWELSCDHCQKYFPTGEGLLVGTAVRTLKPDVMVNITFGVCHDCIVLP